MVSATRAYLPSEEVRLASYVEGMEDIRRKGSMDAEESMRRLSEHQKTVPLRGLL